MCLSAQKNQLDLRIAAKYRPEETMNMMQTPELVHYRVPEIPNLPSSEDADPVTTEVVRHALQSAGNQMKNVLVRTSFSPVVFEALDFSCSIYDRHIRLLAQAETLPIFVGSMSFAIEEAVNNLGGEDNLEPGDAIVYNLPYGSGAHAQDSCIIEPVFIDNGELVGYSTCKVHWGDIAAKDVYCTDTIDIFQEGVIFPGIKLYKAGERVDDIYRMILANSRMPKMALGDIHAQVASCRAGGQELKRIVERHGLGAFDTCVERMMDHGESIVRAFIEKLPDGEFTGTGHLDNHGLNDESIEFEVTVKINGSNVIVDFSKVPDALAGPMNCPFPTTACGSRVSIAMLAASELPPTEGSFRPIEFITRPGSMFHPVSPQPCYLYGWASMGAMDAIERALAKAYAELVPSGSACDVCGISGVGYLPDSDEPFFNGKPLPVGQGASAYDDGATLYIPSLSHSILPSAEIQEAKSPVLFERWEFIPDSCGPGKFRGGMGLAYYWRTLADMSIVAIMERTKVPSWGQQGGLSGKANYCYVEYPDGVREEIGKVTMKPIPAGSLICIECGGGGGYGDPQDRSVEAVLDDLSNGYITEEHAREYYPQAV